MGNVLATAADFVQKTANRVMKAIGNAICEAADSVQRFCTSAKEKLQDLACEAIIGVIKFSVNHPRLFKTIIYATAASLVCLALSPVILSVVMPMCGFTSGGIAAGSLAAAWHATIGNVAAASLFSILQSAAAGGYGVAIVVGILAASGGVSGFVYGLLSGGLDGLRGLRVFCDGGIGPAPAPFLATPDDPTSEESGDLGPDGHAKQA